MALQLSQPRNLSVPDQQLVELLRSVLREQVGLIEEKTRDLIVQVAFEMIKKDKDNFPNGLTNKDLQYSDMRGKLKQTLIAAESVRQYIDVHRHLHSECKTILEKYETLKNSPEPKLEKDKQERQEDLQALREEFKTALRNLNKLEPNPANRAKNEEMINNNDLLDELIAIKTPGQQKTLRDAARPQGAEKSAEDKKADKSLEDTLTNLFGINPGVSGAIVGPVQVVLGDMMGIPDSFPAFSPGEPIHRLSGDLTNNGDKYFNTLSDIALGDSADPEDELDIAPQAEANSSLVTRAKELFSQEIESAVDEFTMDKAMVNQSHESPRLVVPPVGGS